MIASKRRPRRESYPLLVGVVAGIFWVLSTLALLTFQRAPLHRVLGALRGRHVVLSATDILATSAVVGIPLALAVLVALLLALGLRLVWVGMYARAVHGYCERYLLRHDVLRPADITRQWLRDDVERESTAPLREPLRRLLLSSQRVLLLGETGSGKTIALHALASDLTRRRWLPLLLLGRRPLPLLISLAGYADATMEGSHGHLREDYLALQVARFGSGGLARRAREWVRRGRFILLCDGLDEVPDGDRAAVCAELATLGTPAIAQGRIVLTSGMRAYTETSASLAPLRQFTRLILAPVSVERAATASRMVTKTPDADLRQLRLETAVTNAAELAALLTLLGAQEEPPCGRGQLLHAYAALLCQRAATEASQGRAEVAETVRGALEVLLCMLAASLRQTSTQAVRFAAATSVGAATISWLATHEPLTVNDHRASVLTAFPTEEVEMLCRAAIRTGILVVRLDGQAVAFAHTLLAETFAAWWLFRDDDGFGRLHADLLRPRWALPVVLWSALTKDPADVAKRLLRLADTPDSTAARAGLTGRAAVYPAALALAIAAATESFANALAQPPTAPLAATRALDLAQQHLRDLLDQAHIYTDESIDQQARLARALQHVDELVGPEFAASVATLTTHSTLNRLLRAQLLRVLGMLASRPALRALTELLDDMDPVIRQATDAAFALAGGLALEPLQVALASGSATTRARASEVLAGLGDIAIENASDGLRSLSAPERAASAHALGLLRTRQAVEPLIARLDDEASEVRVAAAQALGEIGTEDALAALTAHAASPDPNLRAAVARALGSPRAASAIVPLLALLADPEAEVRTAAAAALGKLGDERAIEPLRERRADPDPWAQQAAVSALRRLGKR